MQWFFHIFESHIRPWDSIVLAVSGGVDSMVLLDLVIKTHPKENIVVAHFDHMLRGKQSDQDRIFVADYCLHEGIECVTERIPVGEYAQKEKSSLEAAARRLRYQFLERIRLRHDAKYILTAHHADDQLETIILNLAKWAKSQWLSGISKISKHLFRPLLHFTKAEIESYALHTTLSHREDASNTDTRYERNKIRHQITPVLLELNPKIHRSIEHLVAYMQEVDAYLESVIIDWLRDEKKYETRKKWDFFRAENFSQLPVLLRRQLIAHLYGHAHNGSHQGLSASLILEIERFISEPSDSYGKKNIRNLFLERRWDKIWYFNTLSSLERS